ncbi:unnamed protein product [Calicophoron daubneyi]|uniref:Peptidase S1 domain-containing protein n=1 Tax=Calicophoron daubneyi TaxID=300641 RepID=A0AAV2THU7_CALDB
MVKFLSKVIGKQEAQENIREVRPHLNLTSSLGRQAGSAQSEQYVTGGGFDTDRLKGANNFHSAVTEMPLRLALFTLQFAILLMTVTGDTLARNDDDGSQRIYRFKRIIGGTPVMKGEYPWAVSVQAKRFRGLAGLLHRNEQHYCGGALIDPTWVVTAAHCLYGEDDSGELIGYLDPKMWHVRMASEKLKPTIMERVKGLYRRAFNAIFGYVKEQPFYHIRNIFHHPKYTKENLEYDIALFQLKEEPVMRKMKHLALIELPNSYVGERWPKVNQSCIAVGWGCSFVDGPPTMRMQSVELPVLSPEDCKKKYAAYINLTTEQEFCAGFRNGNKGICPGDSGGPLVCEDDEGFLRLAGVTSATHSKQPADFPAIFTRVSYFVAWIREVIRQNPQKDSVSLLDFFRLKN